LQKLFPADDIKKHSEFIFRPRNTVYFILFIFIDDKKIIIKEHNSTKQKMTE